MLVVEEVWVFLNQDLEKFHSACTQNEIKRNSKEKNQKNKVALSGDQSFFLQYLKLKSVKLVYCRNLEYHIRKTNEIKTYTILLSRNSHTDN